MTEPTSPRPAVRLVTAPGAMADEPTAAPDDAAMLRLAMWLADVAAEAAVHTTAASAGPSPLEGPAIEPRRGARTI